MTWSRLICAAFWVIAATLFDAGVANADPAPIDVKSQSAIVIDISTNEIIIDKNSDQVRPIASITKLMTAMVVLDANLPLDERIVITNDDVRAAMLRGVPYSGSLTVGTTLTRGELLHLSLMNSQNRAAAAMARTYPGGMQAFVAAMNAKAQTLGMVNTRFVEPTGLMATNVSTAQELAIMVRHALRYERIQQLSTAKQLESNVRYKRGDRPVQFGTTNRLIKLPEWNIELQKTGFITAAGRCMVMVTKAADTSFVVVLLNAASSYDRAADAIRIKSWVETGTVLTAPMVTASNPYHRPKATRKKSRKAKHRR